MILLKEEERLKNEAVVWHTRVHYNKVDREMIMAFYHWINQSPAHRAQYEAVQAFHKATEVFMDDPALMQESVALQDDFKQPLGQVVRALTSGSVKIAGAIAASFLLVAVLLYEFGFYNAGEPLVYETRVAEKREIILADGSAVTLNTSSRMQVDLTDTRRVVTLQKGQGFFKVAKDKNRPFTVRFAGGQVTALGTAFDVYLGTAQTAISLLEGSVKVERLGGKGQSLQDGVTLSSAQSPVQISVQADKLGAVETIGQGAVLAWQRGQLIFKSHPLGEMIAELNRYSDRKIRLAETDMADILITGTFSTDPMETIRMMTHYLGIQAAENRQKEIILSKIKK